MSQNISILHVGLDVAKSTLQLDLAGQPHAVTNDASGHANLLQLLRVHPAAHLVCEAAGGYEQPVVRGCHAAALPISVVEAGRVRHFAKAKGLRAKTDPLDAAVLSEYGRVFQPAATPAPTAQQERLAQLSTRRQQLLTPPSRRRAIARRIMWANPAAARRAGSCESSSGKSPPATKPSRS